VIRDTKIFDLMQTFLQSIDRYNGSKPTEYFVLWAKFSFELCGNVKQNTVNWLIIDALKLLSG